MPKRKCRAKEADNTIKVESPNSPCKHPEEKGDTQYVIEEVQETREECTSQLKDKECGIKTDSYDALTEAQKKAYWQDIETWCDEEFVEATTVCIPRDAVYQRCVCYCDKQGLPHPPTRASFGRVLQKKFKRIVTRRLGQRGESRYYYQGIDVMREREAVEGRVVSMSQVQKQNKVTFKHTKIMS